MKSLTLPRLVVAIAFASLFAMAVRTPADTDMWWHLRSGQYIVETQTLPLTDPFSHTKAGEPWVNHSWLAQIALYSAYALASFPALALLAALLVLVAFGFAWKQMEGGPFLRAFILVLAASTSAVIWAPRPQMFTFALTAVVGYLIYLYKWRQVDRLWLLPPLFVLWANLHGGFAVGFILLAGAIGGEVINHLLRHDGPEVLSWRRLGKLAGLAAASYALLILNPNTTALYTYPLRTVNIGVLRDFIQEWSSPDFHLLFVQPFIWMLIATLAAIGWSGRRLDGGDFALLAGFAYSALLAGRNIAPFALVAAPILSRYARPAIERVRSASRGAVVGGDSGRRPSAESASGEAVVGGGSGRRSSAESASGGAIVGGDSGRRPSAESASRGAVVGGDSGRRPSAESASGEAVVGGGSGRRPSAESASGEAVVGGGSGRRPSAESASRGAVVGGDSGRRPSAESASGEAVVGGGPGRRPSAESASAPSAPLRGSSRDASYKGIVALNWIILTSVLLLAAVKIVAALAPVVQEKAERDMLPVDAANWIEANRPTGSMFNSYNWGGYLIWRLWPEYAVYVDGRTDLYDDAFLRDYLEVAGAQPGFETILDRNQVDWIIIEANSALDAALSRETQWANVYRDKLAVMFRRAAQP